MGRRKKMHCHGRRLFNLQPDYIPVYENIEVIRGLFEKIQSQIPLAETFLPHEFQFNYAVYVKENWPQVWAMGGLDKGDNAFRLWTEYRQGVRSEAIERWVAKERIKFWELHSQRDFHIGGVIAAMKWSIVLEIGEKMMFKKVVRTALQKKLINI